MNYVVNYICVSETNVSSSRVCLSCNILSGRKKIDPLSERLASPEIIGNRIEINHDRSGWSPKKWGYPNRAHAQWSKDVSNFNSASISGLISFTVDDVFGASFFSAQKAFYNR